jgi:hypothetical protein
MSEEKAVVRWDEELAKHAKAAAATERPSVSRISLKGGVMTLLDQRIPNNELTCVVLAAVMEHAYYPNRYDPNNIEAPDCFAFSETGDDMVPHEKAYKKQNETCIGCPQYEWGSDKNSPSGKGKACKQKRKLLIMPADALKNNSIKTAELAVLDIPVTSVRNWATYVNLLSATEARPSWAMVSKIKLEADPRTQIRVSFQPAFPIPEEFLGEIMARAQTSKTVLMVPYEKTEAGLSKKTEAMQSGKKY